MKIGFIGTGNIASAVVEGICKVKNNASSQILVSPRNAQKAEKLANTFNQVKVAKSNQEVVNNSKYLFISIRPNVVEEVLKSLNFHKSQTIISLVPTYPVDKIKPFLGEATHIIRAIPLPPIANHECPVAFYPEDKIVHKIFGEISTPIAVANEQQLHILWTLTALISPYFALLEETCNWAIKNGVDESISKEYTAVMFQVLTNMAVNNKTSSFSDMAKEAATPGGLNEQAVKMIREDGAYDAFTKALDVVIKRFGYFDELNNQK